MTKRKLSLDRKQKLARLSRMDTETTGSVVETERKYICAFCGESSVEWTWVNNCCPNCSLRMVPNPGMVGLS